jgi:aminoglycoside phosphotransferase (APT) family kinase protein
MDRIKGLKEYVGCSEYRDALGLPAEVAEEYELLAQGEYNINYSFTHPINGKKLILRVNCGSQMHLLDQIGYEAGALEILRISGRTPKVYYVDGSKKRIAHGVLVMEYLPGQALDYRSDLKSAAQCLADIHSVPIPRDSHLLSPKEPLRAILNECEEMVKIYMDSPLGDLKTKEKIRVMLDKGWDSIKDSEEKSSYKCCINTELNSTNFLINKGRERDYLIDWEKPLYGDPAQDLGHFLAPTTTFWKTDVILTKDETDKFLDDYIEAVAGLSRLPVSAA